MIRVFHSCYNLLKHIMTSLTCIYMFPSNYQNVAEWIYRKTIQLFLDTTVPLIY